MEKEEKLLKIKQVVEYVSLSKAKIYELRREGKFPASIRVQGSVFWKHSDIQKYIKKVIAAA
ncbi:MAG: helix-turn-helix domain-containing protein [Campylobacterota bacterium]|nr:helix-turn-helix domain-containing protein [Campylobacterota bacterium]